jgi:hypothetical protein
MLELHLVAFHAYRSDDKSHLTFPSGACIIARPGQEGNALWFGSYEQRRGWFPPSYCRIVLVPPRRPRAAYDDRRHSSMKNDRTPPPPSSSPAGMEVTTRSRSLLDQKSGRSSNRGYCQERPDSIDSSWRSRSLDNDESDHASRNEPTRDDDDDDLRVLPPFSGNSSIGTPKARSGQSIFAKVDRFVEELLIRSDHLPLLPEPADESETHATQTTTVPPAKLCHRFQDNVERNVPITAFSGDVVDSSSIIRNSPQQQQQQQQSSDIRGNDSRRTRNDNINSKVTADHHRPSTLTCPNHTMTKNQSTTTTTTSSPWTTTTTPNPSKVWNKGHRRATSEIIVTTNALQQYRDNIHPPVFIVQKTEMEEENDDPIDPIEVLAAEFRRRQLRARLRRVQPISAS